MSNSSIGVVAHPVVAALDGVDEALHHHRSVHHHGWNIQHGPDGIPEYIPPARIDPAQTPRRNTRPRYYRNKSPAEP